MTLFIRLLTFTGMAMLSACQSSWNPKPVPESSTWVARDLGLKQCEPANPAALIAPQNILLQHQIRVLDAYCATDGMMHMQLCGSPQGKLGIYQIHQSQLDSAIKLGLQQIDAKQFSSVNCA